MDTLLEDLSQNIAKPNDLLASSNLEHYRFSPPSFLQEYVEHVWTLKTNTGLKIRQEILVPNGRPGFIICLGRPGIRVDSLSGKTYPNANIYYSVTTRPFAIEQQGSAYYIGVELKPYGLAAFTAARPRHIADSIGLLSELFGTSAVEELQHTLRSEGSLSSAVKHLITFLTERVHPLSSTDLTRLACGTDLIQKRDGIIKIAELVHIVGVSPSTLRRLFNRYIGTSPEQFIGVVRYDNFVSNLMHAGAESHILAALHGYYDEAHAAKDFKKYTGLNKKAFLNTCDGLARIMHARG